MKELFKKTAIGLSLSAAMMSVALPAMAGESFTYDKRFEKNCQMKPTEFCQGAAQTLSKRAKWLPIVAYGGNEKLFDITKRVVRRLNDNNIRAYLVHAPDSDNWAESMDVDYYAKGGTRFEATAYDNGKNTDQEIEDGLYNHAIAAFEDEYGKIAKVEQPSQPTIDRTVALVNH